MKADPPKQQKKKSGTVQGSWIATIFISTVLISALFSTVSEILLTKVNILAAFVILLVIVLIGILFDVIGVAVTAADLKPFHSMAAHKVRGAQEALKMLKNADRVSSFCNDVIGDICGVISGSASAVIAGLILTGHSGAPAWIGILLAALVSGVTVGGKAVGKTLAMDQSTRIVHMAATVVYTLRFMPTRLSRLIEGQKKK